MLSTLGEKAEKADSRIYSGLEIDKADMRDQVGKGF